MANYTHNSESHANFKAFLAETKGFAEASDVKSFLRFREEYDRLQAEKNKYSRTEADKRIAEARDRLIGDPSPENIAARANLNPQEIVQRFEGIRNDCHNAQLALCVKVKHLTNRILSAALSIAESEIEKVEAENRATSARYGVKYSPDRDVVLMSLQTWHRRVSSNLERQAEDRTGMLAFRPDDVEQWVGEVRAKAGFFGS